MLTEVSDAIGGVISETSQARNELLSGGLSSGWKQLLDQGIADEGRFIESIQEVARESGDAFDKLVADSESFSDALNPEDHYWWGDLDTATSNNILVGIRRF